MKIMQMSAVAQEIIDAVASLVGGRTINIMDTEGIIIASSDSSRIGSYHKGAAEAVLNRKDVHISPEELPFYPGAKEGINMPIIKDDQILGVVGIYGEPSEVSEAALQATSLAHSYSIIFSLDLFKWMSVTISRFRS